MPISHGPGLVTPTSPEGPSQVPPSAGSLRTAALPEPMSSPSCGRQTKELLCPATGWGAETPPTGRAPPRGVGTPPGKSTRGGGRVTEQGARGERRCGSPSPARSCCRWPPRWLRRHWKRAERQGVSSQPPSTPLPRGVGHRDTPPAQAAPHRGFPRRRGSVSPPEHDAPRRPSPGAMHGGAGGGAGGGADRGRYRGYPYLLSSFTETTSPPSREEKKEMEKLWSW